MVSERYTVTGMTCAACQANVTRRVERLAGVDAVEVSLLKNEMRVDYDPAALTPEDIMAAVTEIGYGAVPKQETRAATGLRQELSARKKRQMEEEHHLKRRLICSVALLLPLMYLAMGRMVGLPLPPFLAGDGRAAALAFTQFLFSISVLVINHRFFVNGYRALLHRAPNMDSLVAIGSSASMFYALAIYYALLNTLGSGDVAAAAAYTKELYFESAAMIPTLVTLGKYLEALSKGKTGEALEKLNDLAPKTACVIRAGRELRIPSEQIVVGDELVIRPGERIPVDGIVTSGRGYLDQAAITGESLPVEKTVGDTILSATMNTNGSFHLRATSVGDDTTLAKIIRLVDEAGSTKAPMARLADRVSGVFVPIVMGIALLTGLIWGLAGAELGRALSFAITVLVISCPCALGLATPVAIMVGTGKAAESGILFKTAASLEQLCRVDTLVLDKTGTLTEGKPRVVSVHLMQCDSEEQLLRLAAGLENESEHPLSKAVIAYAGEKGITPFPVTDFLNLPGRGVQALCQGQPCYGGSMAFLETLSMLDDAILVEARECCTRLAGEGKTPLLFAWGARLLGILAVADAVKPTSRAAIEALKVRGIEVWMLTGDNPITAKAIAAELAIDHVVSEVLPAGKEAEIRRLMDGGRRVAMVGDGINDAPALMRAEVGIAIGRGADIAVDSADIVLMRDSLLNVDTAIDLSHRVVNNIKTNLFWAFFYNALGIPIAAGALYPSLGISLNPMIGAAAMSLSSVTVVSNALRLKRFRGALMDKAEIPVQTELIENQKQEDKLMEKKILVEGMMCQHCVKHVEKALVAVEGVTGVDVSLEGKCATVKSEMDIPADKLIAAIVDAGYEARLG